MASHSARVSSESEGDRQETTLNQREVRRAMQRRACEIQRRELKRARTRLESNCELTAAQHQVLTATATAIAAGILAGPESVIADGDLYEETLQQADELFRSIDDPATPE